MGCRHIGEQDAPIMFESGNDIHNGLPSVFKVVMRSPDKSEKPILCLFTIKIYTFHLHLMGH
jgi:hypothetical protein